MKYLLLFFVHFCTVFAFSNLKVTPKSMIIQQTGSVVTTCTMTLKQFGFLVDGEAVSYNTSLPVPTAKKNCEDQKFCSANFTNTSAVFETGATDRIQFSFYYTAHLEYDVEPVPTTTTPTKTTTTTTTPPTTTVAPQLSLDQFCSISLNLDRINKSSTNSGTDIICGFDDDVTMRCFIFSRYSTSGDVFTSFGAMFELEFTPHDKEDDQGTTSESNTQKADHDLILCILIFVVISAILCASAIFLQIRYFRQQMAQLTAFYQAIYTAATQKAV